MAHPAAQHTLSGLREVRDLMGISIQELAFELDIDRETLSKIEKNEPVRKSTIDAVVYRLVEYTKDKVPGVFLDKSNGLNYRLMVKNDNDYFDALADELRDFVVPIIKKINEVGNPKQKNQLHKELTNYISFLRAE